MMMEAAMILMFAGGLAVGGLAGLLLGPAKERLEAAYNKGFTDAMSAGLDQ
jgi:hypothetical protein